MPAYVLLYLLLGASLALIAYPVLRAARGRGHRFDLLLALSIPLLVAVAMFLGSGAAYAQSGVPGLVWQTPPPSSIAGPYSSWFPPGQTGWVLDRPPSTSAVPAASGLGPRVGVATTGTAIVTRPTLPNITVPINTRTLVPAAAAGAAAGRAAAFARAAMGPVGAAWLGWDIYNRVRDSGVTVCPPPDFFCFPPKVDVDFNQLGWTSDQFPTVKGSINQIVQYTLTTAWQNDPRVKLAKPPACSSLENKKGVIDFCKWEVDINGPIVVYGARRAESATVTETPGPPMSEGDLANHMTTAATADQSGQTALNMFNAMVDAHIRLMQAGHPGIPAATALPPASSTTTVTSSPVTVGPDVVSTSTGVDAAGQPVNTTTTATTTVTPTSTGNGSATNITYNITYTTNNTSVNPSNPSAPPKVESQTIIIKVEPASVAPPSSTPTEFPKDYNKEATQLRIENLLKGEGVPDGSSLSSEASETGMKAAQASGKAVIDGITPESVGVVSWLPDVPTAKCVNPTVTNPANGKVEEFNMCEPVDLFSKFISAVICVFVLYGCVREVQAAIAT